MLKLMSVLQYSHHGNLCLSRLHGQVYDRQTEKTKKTEK